MPRTKNRNKSDETMKPKLNAGLSLLAASAALLWAAVPANAADAQPQQNERPNAQPQQNERPNAQPQQARGNAKPNILFIMGDDIGRMQPSCYHRGLMVGETPNIDRIAHEGGMFMHYYSESSCTAGRCAFVTGMNPLRAGMLLPQLPGAISYLRPGTPSVGQFMLDRGYTTDEFGKNHLGDHPDSLPTAHGFQEFWGYLYHLDAMQGVSFPDINKSPTDQAVVPPMKMVPIPGVPDAPGAIDPKDGVCMAAPRPLLHMKSSDGTAKNQMGKDEGPLTLKRSKTIDEEISAHVIDFLDRNDPKKTNKPFFCYYNPAACTSRRCSRRSTRPCWA